MQKNDSDLTHSIHFNLSPLLLLHQKGRKDKEWETDSACQRFPLCVFCPKNR